MIRMNRFAPAAILVAFTFCYGATANADEWSKTYTIANRADLRVQTDDGDVHIASAAGKQIVAHVTTEGYAIGPNDVRIDENQSGDHVIVTVKTTRNFNLFSLPAHRAIHVQLTVPRDLDMEVSTGDGSVDLQPLSGRIQIRTGDGSIHADGVGGTVTLHTGDGGIDAQNLDGTFTLGSGDGSIHVAGRFDGLDVNTGDGGVHAQANAGSQMITPWTLHSGDGSIYLSVPADLRAFVDIKTGDGHISLGVPVTIEGSIDHSHVRGNLNGGGSELKITSGDGSIQLARS